MYLYFSKVTTFTSLEPFEFLLSELCNFAFKCCKDIVTYKKNNNINDLYQSAKASNAPVHQGQWKLNSDVVKQLLHLSLKNHKTPLQSVHVTGGKAKLLVGCCLISGNKTSNFSRLLQGQATVSFR